MRDGRKGELNDSNPFVPKKGLEHLPGVVEYPWGTVSVLRERSVQRDQDGASRCIDDLVSDNQDDGNPVIKHVGSDRR
jgi:hypothetical protein